MLNEIIHRTEFIYILDHKKVGFQRLIGLIDNIFIFCERHSI
jgi:hypothetical protein